MREETMPVDPRLEAAFEALERTLLDSKRRLIIGEMGCAIVAEELEEAIEAAGASLLYLPPYSPDFNPIENAFAKLKAKLRKVGERTVDALWSAIGRISGTFTPTECANYFAAAGYDPD